MRTDKQPVLVIGYGNPARGDDGLAPAFIERLGRLELPGVETRVAYQLCVEYAMELGNYNQVVFVDASIDAPPPFRYAPVTRDSERRMDTHSLSPGALVFLAETLFDTSPTAGILAIRGYDFQPFSEVLSPGAEENLQRALAYFLTEFRPAAARADPAQQRHQDLQQGRLPVIDDERK